MDRANSEALNMGLTSYKGEVVRKGDIATAKNYLTEKEISSLNRLVTMFLDFAEDRASRRQEITMNDWMTNSEKFLKFNEREVLNGPGARSHESMISFVDTQYQDFDKNRKYAELKKAEEEFIKDSDELMKIIKLKK